MKAPAYVPTSTLPKNTPTVSNAFMSGLCNILKRYPNGPGSYSAALKFQGDMRSFLAANAPRNSGSGPLVNGKTIQTILIESNTGDDQAEILSDQQALYTFFATKCQAISQLYSFFDANHIGSALAYKASQLLDEYGTVPASVAKQLQSTIAKYTAASEVTQKQQDVTDSLNQLQSSILDMYDSTGGIIPLPKNVPAPPPVPSHTVAPTQTWLHHNPQTRLVLPPSTSASMLPLTCPDVPGDSGLRAITAASRRRPCVRLRPCLDSN